MNIAKFALVAAATIALNATALESWTVMHD